MNRQPEALDVHFEIRPNTPKEWTERSFYGLKQAVEQAEFPIHVYLVRGLGGFAGTMCGGGYTCGTSLYATHCAVEEYVLPNAFIELGRILFSADRPCSLSEVVIRNGKMVRNLSHDLMVVRGFCSTFSLSLAGVSATGVSVSVDMEFSRFLRY